MKKLLIVPAVAALLTLATAGTLYVQKIILQLVYNAELATTVFDQGELVYVEDTDTVVVGDGTTAGGAAMATQAYVQGYVPDPDVYTTVGGTNAVIAGTITKLGTAVESSQSNATGPKSFAVNNSNASGELSFSAGIGNASGLNSVSINGGTASGVFSFALGPSGHATNDFSYVWNDGTAAFYSTTTNQYSAYASSGFRFLGGTAAFSGLTTTGGVSAASLTASGAITGATVVATSSITEGGTALASKYIPTASAPFLYRRFASGKWYVGDGMSTTEGTQEMSDNVMYLIPFSVGEATTFDRIGVEVTEEATNSVIRLGIYSTTDHVNATLVVDAGTVDSASAGAKEITIAQALPRGNYWLAAAAQGGAPTVKRKLNEGMATAAQDALSDANVHAWRVVASVTGAFPATPNTSQSSSTTRSYKIMLRAQ